MAYTFQDRSFTKIGVVGSGQIGPDIALYFAKVFARHGVRIVVVDISEEALKRGEAKLLKKVAKGEETGAFDPDWAEAMRRAVTFTSDYGELDAAEFVVEAATEDRGLKGKIFAELERRCAQNAILASNSSHLEPEVIFEGLEHKERALVIHYFFPAERNPIVEIVPGRDTDPKLADFLLDLYEAVGKVPIKAGSRYGYALDPVFEGVFQAAALLLEEGVGTTKEIDAVACKALGLTVGPFTAMNLTGGNPITNIGLTHYHEKIHPWFRAPRILEKAVADGTVWEVPKRGEEVDVAPDKAERITKELRGAFFGLVCEVVDAGVSNIDDMDMAVEIALDMKPPFRFMNELGTREALALVEAYAQKHEGFPVPALLKEHGAQNRPFEIRTVHRKDTRGVAVLKIRRPKVLNALDQGVFEEIAREVERAQEDPEVRAVVLTGFGVKAFVSGADVRFLARIETPEQGERTSRESQAAVDRVAACRKPVVCAYNGLAFGGGNELAMACHYRIARAGLKVLAGQPEPNLGIIPGAGGTQRLPRLVGLEKGAELLRTARPISSTEALEIGLVSELVDGTIVDLRERAIEAALELAEGSLEPRKVPEDPIANVPDELPEVELGHLSRAVDKILCEAILEGAKLPLKDGLALEARKFGEVCALEDMRIGVKTFLEKGPRARAPFVHR